MRFETTGTVKTSSGLEVIDPIIIVELQIMGADIINESKQYLSAKIIAFVNTEEEDNGGASFILRKDGVRDVLSQVNINLDSIIAESIEESVEAIIRRSAKDYLETQLNITITN